MSIESGTAPLKVVIVDLAPSLVEALKRYLAADREIEVVGAFVSVSEAVSDFYRLAPDGILVGLRHDDDIHRDELRRLRALAADAYIVASSFDPQLEGRLDVLAAGANEYVPGFRLEEDLVPALRRSRHSG